ELQPEEQAVRSTRPGDAHLEATFAQFADRTRVGTLAVQDDRGHDPVRAPRQCSRGSPEGCQTESQGEEGARPPSQPLLLRLPSTQSGKAVKGLWCRRRPGVIPTAW